MILEGIRMIEWSSWQVGPIAGRLLASMGAEVIKIEDMKGGDPARAMQRVWGVGTRLSNDHSIHHELYNHSKKCICIDLNKTEGREIVYRLVSKSDIFIQNLRLGVAERMGMTYDILRQHNPKLIYANGRGLGPKGPDAHLASMNEVGLARSGIMFTPLGDSNPPTPVGGGLADQVTAIVLAFGLVSALLARERLGIGQEITTSQLAAMITLNELPVAVTGFTNLKFPNRDRTCANNPLWNSYKCKEGRWIMLAHLQSDRYWTAFCTAIERPDLEHHPLFDNMVKREKNCRELIRILDEVFLRRTYADWRGLLEKQRLIYTSVNDFNQLLEDPQVTANDYVTEYEHPVLGKIRLPSFPVRFHQTPAVDVRSPAPVYGQHTEDVLIEIGGYTWDELTKLKEKEVIP
ncbi:MAG: CoA transferase [Desulfobacteraceae bacterium]|nr:MAG: CoA transferase [Desulfobacteraceae bacterium]